MRIRDEYGTYYGREASPYLLASAIKRAAAPPTADLTFRAKGAGNSKK